MKLRLYHHPDGARIAYREAGTGPPLALLHSKGLTHRELEPVVDALAHRHRVVLPDLPLHGASEDRPTPSYSPEWLVELLAGFIARDLRPAAAASAATASARCSRCARWPSGALQPSKLVLLPNPMHTKPPRSGMEKAGSVAVRLAVVPGCDRLLARAGALVLRPSRGDRLTVTDDPGARDLVRHALMDLAGNGNRVRSWAQGRAALAARRAEGPAGRLRRGWTSRCCCCGPTRTRCTRWRSPRRRWTCSPTPLLRVLPRTGFLIAYDDPVGVARELVAFCG